jgi:hypothetical protein
MTNASGNAAMMLALLLDDKDKLLAWLKQLEDREALIREWIKKDMAECSTAAPHEGENDGR